MKATSERAVIIPANPYDVSVPAVGSILAHSRHADRYGKAFWQVWPPGEVRKKLGTFPSKGIKTAYFYDVLSHRVRYKAKVHSILSGSETRSMQRVESYVPAFRRAHWRSPWKGYWILISKMSELQKPVRLREFLLVDGGQRVRQVRRYAVVEDPRLAAIDE